MTENRRPTGTELTVVAPSGMDRIDLDAAKNVPPPDRDATRALAALSLSPNTLRGYTSDWKKFASWCALSSLMALPATAETVALYLEARSTGAPAKGETPAKVATLQRLLSAIATIHRMKGHASPCESQVVVRVLEGIKRSKGVAQTQKAPILVDELRKMVGTISATSLRGLRDRAMLVLGFAGAYRRSELATITAEELVIRDDAIEHRSTRRTKTTQTGELVVRSIEAGKKYPELCPVRTVRAWLAASKIKSGPIFRYVATDGRTLLGPVVATGADVARIVKVAARRAGLDAKRYSGHSLRSGFVTSVRSAGGDLGQVAQMTQHRNLNSVARYDRPNAALRPKFGEKLGL